MTRAYDLLLQCLEFCHTDTDDMKGKYLFFVVRNAGLIVDLALTCLTIGALLELWEWIRLAL